MNVESEEYQNHPVFAQLDELISFYDWWSFAVMSFMTMGIKSVINIDTYLFSSIKCTLNSIKLILKMGQINDAYALIRKYNDSIIMDVYIHLYLDNNHSIENFIVQKIDGWLQGTEQLPNFRGMTNYIKDDNATKELYALMNLDDRYDRIRDRCNNNTHYNFYSNVMLNDDKIHNVNRGKYLDAIDHDLKHLVILHLGYMFSIAEHYMLASDYTDHLDLGMTPPEGSQNWVAAGVQNIFDELIKKHRKDIADYILRNTSMELE